MGEDWDVDWDVGCGAAALRGVWVEKRHLERGVGGCNWRAVERNIGRRADLEAIFGIIEVVDRRLGGIEAGLSEGKHLVIREDVSFSASLA